MTTVHTPPRFAKLLRLCRLSLLMASASACSSSVQPSSTVTVLVTNQTCSPGPCAPLQILGFPSNQPHTPGGLWSVDLGVITTPSACLTLPPTATFRVTDLSNGATTTYTWTTADSLSLGAQLTSASRLQATPSTSAFVPMSAPGWSVSLPGGSRASSSGVCAPL